MSKHVTYDPSKIKITFTVDGETIDIQGFAAGAFIQHRAPDVEWCEHLGRDMNRREHRRMHARAAHEARKTK